jgi:hypothetical protein
MVSPSCFYCSDFVRPVVDIYILAKLFLFPIVDGFNMFFAAPRSAAGPGYPLVVPGRPVGIRSAAESFWGHFLALRLHRPGGPSLSLLSLAGEKGVKIFYI